jgi:hypothetical protein
VGWCEGRHSDREVRCREKLRAEWAELHNTSKGKDQIALDLIAQRLLLREAVAKFRNVDGKALDREIYARYMGLGIPCASEEERLCRIVMQHALQ